MSRDQPAAELARQLYPSCGAHSGAALEVLGHLHELLNRTVTVADHDTTLAELLGFSGRGIPALLPKREAEMLAIAEKELAAGVASQREPCVVEGAAALWVLSYLWGGPGRARSANNPTAWSPLTVWSRSPRGVVNERVRTHKSRESCSCEAAA